MHIKSTERKVTMDFTSTLKQVLLAGIGAASLGAEKGKELIEKLAEKGAITAEEGKRITDELKEKAAARKDERAADKFVNMAQEARDKLREMLDQADEIAKELAAAEAAAEEEEAVEEEEEEEEAEEAEEA